MPAEHEPLRLTDPPALPPDAPKGAALPVLAIPVVNQHALSAVVLYGSHANHTLVDPDEVELLQALTKAAAAAHQQVRLTTLTREAETQRIRNDQLEASLRVLAQERGAVERGRPA